MDERSLGLHLDPHRELRTGHAEAVYSPGKTPEQVAVATGSLVQHANGAVFATRATLEQFEAVRAVVPGATYDELSRLIVAKRGSRGGRGSVAIVSAGAAPPPPPAEGAQTTAAARLVGGPDHYLG